MKRISLDNGATYLAPSAALRAMDLETMAHYMDDDAREFVAGLMAPCSPYEFLTAYLEAAAEDLVIG